MPYHHVLLTFQNDPQTVRCVLADLSEKELRTRFVTPYRRGKNILCGSEIVEVSQIKTVNIVRTAHTSDTELKRIQEEHRKEIDESNRRSRAVLIIDTFVYQLKDIDKAGEDVTPAFIVGPPGHGDGWTVVTALLKHGWSIAATLIAAALIWWFGWN